MERYPVGYQGGGLDPPTPGSCGRFPCAGGLGQEWRLLLLVKCAPDECPGGRLLRAESQIEELSLVDFGIR